MQHMGEGKRIHLTENELSGTWEILRGSAYLKAERMNYMRQLGVSMRKIGAIFGVCGQEVARNIYRRERLIRAHNYNAALPAAAATSIEAANALRSICLSIARK